jgi:nicotinamide mononucleotide transporter
MKLFSALLFILFFQCGFAATYYISPKGNDNTGSGSLTNPWQSLAKATSLVTTPGDIIHVLQGTYTEAIRSVLVAGVSIEGDGPASVIQSTLTQEFVAIIIAGSPEGTNGNQHISNIKLDGNNRTTSWAIEIRGRSNVSIHDCIIVDFEDRGIVWTARNDNKDAAPEIYATGNTFFNNTVTNCAKYDGYGRGCLNIGGQEGMLIYKNNITQTGREIGKNGWPVKYHNGGYLKGCRIYNNIITKQPYDGITWDFAIELFNESGLEIYDNTIQGSIDLNYQKKENYPYSAWIHNNVISQHVLNKHVEAGIILEFSTEAVIIENNRLKNIGTQVFFTPREGDLINNVTIKNNTCENIGVADKSHKGFAIRIGSDDGDGYFITNLFVTNNVFTASDTQKPYWGFGILGALKANNIQIRNNTIKNFSAGYIVANPASVIDTMVVENNILSNNGFANKPAFNNGQPQYYFAKNNSSANPSIFSLINIKMNIIRPFYYAAKNMSLLEFIAVFAAIISLWFSRKENIYAYPIGLISVIISIFLNLEQDVPGQAVIGFYFIVTGIYGWLLWSKRDRRKHRIVRVTASSNNERLLQLTFFIAVFLLAFFCLTYLKTQFAVGNIPWADAFVTAASFTAMWLMVKKKTESWYWWIAASIVSIPLYFVKHFIFISVNNGLVLIMAIAGLYGWKKKSAVKRKSSFNS